MSLMRFGRPLAVVALCGYLIQPAFADVSVFVDFTTDNHNGTGGAANGTADWIDELNQATTSAGVANFNAAERAQIETNILNDLNTIFGNYQVNFSTTTPAGEFETIYFGAETNTNVLGFAPLDIGNMFTADLGITNVGTEEFDFFIESFEARSQQITEISAGLAGTAAHELGHSVGLLHHHAYSDERITPDNYANTMGFQNDHVIATGSTGLDELGRETLRDFSPFEQVMLDISGGAATTFFGQDNDSLVMNPVISDRFDRNGGDAGATIGTAHTLAQSVGETSGLDIAFAEADLDAASGDVDVFRLDFASAGRLSAHFYSSSLLFGSGAEFDGQIELLNNAGTVLASNDDVRYDSDVYNSGTLRTTDSFLNNIEITSAGDYYVRVSGVGGEELDSNYWLISAFSAVPEPSSLSFLLLAGAGAVFRRKRRDEADAE